MVHSGGFYVVEKQGADVLLPQKLHWFKWEAALTWLSGFFLLGLVYYGGGLMVDDSVRKMSVGAAAGLSIAWLIAAWVIYHLMWVSPWPRNQVASGGTSSLPLLATTFVAPATSMPG